MMYAYYLLNQYSPNKSWEKSEKTFTISTDKKNIRARSSHRQLIENVNAFDVFFLWNEIIFRIFGS